MLKAETLPWAVERRRVMKSKLYIENGDLVWRNNKGECHRDPKDGPAYIVANGRKEYWFNGELHRDAKDGPAIICADGRKQYWFNDQRHRDPKDGPAVILANGTKEYWFNGEKVCPKEE